MILIDDVVFDYDVIKLTLILAVGNIANVYEVVLFLSFFVQQQFLLELHLLFCQNDGGYKTTIFYRSKTQNFIARQVYKAWPTINW